jgi:chromosome partition protein MukB
VHVVGLRGFAADPSPVRAGSDADALPDLTAENSQAET